MKKRIILLITSFLLGYYAIDIIRFFIFYRPFVVEDSKMISCSKNNNLCAEFNVINNNEYLPYYLANIKIENKNDNSFSQITNFAFSIADHPLKSTQLIWTKNNQLDIFLEGNKSENTSDFFFKNLGDIKIFIHQPDYEY